MKTIHLLLVMLLVSTVASAAIIKVPGDFPTIQGAIDAASGGDTVVVMPGTYVENIDFKSKAITVKSNDGPEVTVIDGGNPVNPDHGSAVVFIGQETNDSVLEGFTITNGSGTYYGPWGLYLGGGIWCASSPTIRRNIINGNTSDYGGGIGCLVSSAIIESNVIVENEANTGLGGGIYCYGYNYFGNMIKNNLIDKNSAANGGGLAFDKDQNSMAVNNTISNNTAQLAGGIICAQASTSSILNNLIVSNKAEGLGWGGGMAITGYSDPQVMNNTLTLNFAQADGAGICIVTANPLSPIRNSIIWGNMSPYGSEIYLYNGWVSFMYCDVKGGSQGTGNIDADPLFHEASRDDFRLRQDPCQSGVINPCVDAGDPSSSMVDGTTRTDGIQDSGIVDMGYHYPLPKILYVPAEYATIQEAIDAALIGDTVIVAPGTYHENITFKGKAVKVKSQQGAEVTILDGNQTGSVVSFTAGEGPSSIIAGFTIINGKYSKGGGIHCGDDCSPTIIQNVITGNSAWNALGGDGGGIFLGGGSLATVRNNVIAKNTAGGGQKNRGGGIFCLKSSAPLLTNNTVWENLAALGGGIYCDASAFPTIINTIVWGSAGSQIHGNPDVFHCDVEGGWAGPGNINQDPLLADPANGDYHLTWLSPCINRGTNIDAPSGDLEGDTRPTMGTADMGADEFTGTHALAADVFFLDSNLGGPVQFTLDAGPGNGGRYYAILTSVHGTAPGFWLPKNKAIMPLNWDGITDYAITYLNTWTFDQFLGVLDPLGQAKATFNSNWFIKGWYDITMSFAFTMNNPFDFASNPIDVVIDY